MNGMENVARQSASPGGAMQDDLWQREDGWSTWLCRICDVRPVTSLADVRLTLMESGALSLVALLLSGADTPPAREVNRCERKSGAEREAWPFASLSLQGVFRLVCWRCGAASLQVGRDIQLSANKGATVHAKYRKKRTCPATARIVRQCCTRQACNRTHAMRLPTVVAGLIACLVTNVAGTSLTYKLEANEKACFYVDTKTDNEKVSFYFAV